MDLARYLDRIGFTGDPAPTQDSLKAVQRLHLRAIPYENIDVQLGRTLTNDPAPAFTKLVTRRRGGWCYEMNGLLGWALGEMGFRVRRLPGAVYRSVIGDRALGNHLVLRIDLGDEAMLADVGLAFGPLSPCPIVEGPFRADGFDFHLAQVGDGWWRFHNPPEGMAPNFDFRLEGTDEALLARACIEQQTNPRSLFVTDLLCHRFIASGGHVQLRGRVLRDMEPPGATERVLGSEGEFIDALADTFGIEDPALGELWPMVCARHDEVFR